MIICYTVREIWRVTDVTIFHLGIFFTLLPPQQPKNQKKKKIKTPGYIIILHMCTKNYDQITCGSWDIVHSRQTDGGTDEQKKRLKEMGAPPKKQ